MRTKLMFLAGAAIGYVLGARDGRGRYEQLKSQADSLWHDPRVQDKVNQATQTAKEATHTAKQKAPEVKAKASEAVEDASAAAKDKVDEKKNEDDILIGTEPGSNYTPNQTRFDSAN